MDKRYSTIQQACKQAIRAHNNEKRVHVIFFDLGMFRIKPNDELGQIDEKKVYGWTVPLWCSEDLHPDMRWEDVKKLFPMGDGAFIRKQFYKKDGHFSPDTYGIKTCNRYTHDELIDCILNGQKFK